MAIGFILKGKQQDIIILADSLQEAQNELKKHEKDIAKYVSVRFTPKVDTMTKRTEKISITSLILELKSDGFFNNPQGSNDIRKRLAVEGHHYPAASLTWSLQQLVRKRELGRIPDGKTWKYVQR